MVLVKNNKGEKSKSAGQRAITKRPRVAVPLILSVEKRNCVVVGNEDFSEGSCPLTSVRHVDLHIKMKINIAGRLSAAFVSCFYAWRNISCIAFVFLIEKTHVHFFYM